MQRTSKLAQKQWIYTCRSLWIAQRRESTLFGVVDDSTTTKFARRASPVHCISLPVVDDGNSMELRWQFSTLNEFASYVKDCANVSLWWRHTSLGTVILNCRFSLSAVIWKAHNTLTLWIP